jgi:hypothetical protein
MLNQHSILFLTSATRLRTSSATFLPLSAAASPHPPLLALESTRSPYGANRCPPALGASFTHQAADGLVSTAPVHSGEERFQLWKSRLTHGSSPTTQASWPGGTATTSPAAMSASVPSSMTT